MYRKLVWCYIIVSILLDISLNTKLSAQGKSHGNGVSVHESLMEGISLQEWGKEQGAETRARMASGSALALWPPALEFGRRALAAAHALSVTITNTANETVHLASVAGTTPDFHASFFESKTLSPQANTTFSVVYLGRREGPAAASLYIHTSKGVHKYPVSAVGVASEWRVWPLVGLRVPLNATLEPLLTLYNPTDTTIQVREVYSSGAWLGLALPDGEGAAPRGLWALAPHATRPLVRLRVQPPHRDQHAPLTAYIRIKGNMTGGGLVVGVEAAPAPAGEFLSPLQLRLRTRGSKDPPDTVFLSAGSSAEAAARLELALQGSCAPAHAHAHPLSHPYDKTNTNGATSDVSGVEALLLRAHSEPQQPLTRTAQLTLDYNKMWAGYEASLSNGSGGGGGVGAAAGGDSAAYCAGWVRVGRAALPYSLRLLRGTLAFEPHEMHFVTCNKEEVVQPKELMARNEFPEPIRITYVEFPPEVKELFHTESLAPLELAPGAERAACRVWPRADALARTLQARLTLHTNLTDYTVPLLLYEGTFRFEWEWPNSEDGHLRLGAVGTSSTHVVGVRLHNAGPATLCITHLTARLGHAAARFHLQDKDRQASCVPGGGWRRALLALVAPLGWGAARGAAVAHTRHGAARAEISLQAHQGRLRADPVVLPAAAPYVPSYAALELENTMPLRMRVLNVSHPPGQEDPALTYIPESEGAGEVRGGRGAVGRVRYSPEPHCEPHCYTGLQINTAEGTAWVVRGQKADEGTFQLDAELQRARYAMFTPLRVNFTLHLHTTEVVVVPVVGAVEWAWPRVWAPDAGGAARAGLCGVGGSVPLRLRAHNPAARPLLLQPRLAIHPLHLGGAEETGEAGETGACVGCVWSAASFQLGEWRVTRGAAAAWRRNATAAAYLLLQPAAEVEFTVTFAPTQPQDLAAYLYLRNNLTILERVLLTGRGAHPTFELGGRKPNSSSPIVFEVSECWSGAGGGGAGSEGAGVARRALVVRNTGRVPLRLRDWRLAGQPCLARAFRLQPCAPTSLAPHETKELHLMFAADWTTSRAQATLTVRAGASVARFTLQGLAPARLVAACAAQAPRPPFESTLRWGGALLAALALLGAAALAAADAERALRRHRSARDARPPHAAPLDLRALARHEPAPPAPAAAPPPRAPPAPRRRRTPRRPPPPQDAAQERRAFERWRAGVERRALRDDSRSDDDDPEGEEEGEGGPAPLPPIEHAEPRGDASSSSPDSSPPPRDSYSSLSRRAEEEEGGSTGEESSSPAEEAAPDAWPRRAAREPAPHAPDPPHAPSRGSRQRRESAEARRTERKSAEAGNNGENSSNGTGVLLPPARPAHRLNARKERLLRRRAPPSPRSASPAAAAEPRLRPASPRPSPRARRPPPAAAAAAPAPARWGGASWSDVVSRRHAADINADGSNGGAPPPLAPIGSDVRRRHGSHSLFYYGGGGAPSWPPPAPADPPPPPAPAPAPPAPGQYLPMPRVIDTHTRWNEEENMTSGYRSLESLWGSSMEQCAPPAAAWLWGGGGVPPAHPAGEAVRPPPGFPSPRPVRPYDPFQSLASIWTPAALDWRLDTSTPPPPGAGPAPAPAGDPAVPDDKYDTNGTN